MRLWTVVVCLVVTAALAGCGGDDGDDDPSGPATTTTTSPTPSDSATPTEPTDEPTVPAEPTEPAGSETATEPVEPTPPVDLSQPPTTADEAAAHVAAARQGGGAVQELARFRSADDQFYCSFGEDFIRPSCEVLDAVEDLGTCADSMSPRVGRIELTRRGWAPFCNTDTIRQPGAPVLAQGAVAAWPAASVECVLEAVGLTCVATDAGEGFFLGSGRYQVF